MVVDLSPAMSDEGDMVIEVVTDIIIFVGDGDGGAPLRRRRPACRRPFRNPILLTLLLPRLPSQDAEVERGMLAPAVPAPRW